LAILGLGGDNFSTDYHKLPYRYFSSIEKAQNTGVPFIVWGASTGRLNADFENYGIDMLRKATLITVRESISYDYLLDRGLTNVKLVSDPAFAMLADKPDLSTEYSQFLSEGNVLGINLSPLYGRFYHEGQIGWKQCCVDIVDEILTKTDFRILLVPHVFKEGDNDECFMQGILSCSSRVSHKRVMLLPGHKYSSPELKWVIGQMRYFIGARTHATIAALSQKVPTLSLGYSVKAQGINNDIFGHQNWIVPAESLSAEITMGKLRELIEAEKVILQKYNDIMPKYVERAWLGGQFIKDML